MDPFTDIIRFRHILFQNRLGVLCGQQLGLLKSCEALISIESFDKLLEDSSKSYCWIRVADVLMPLIDINTFKGPFEKLLKQIFNNDSLIGRNEFLERVWKNAEHICVHIGVSLIEKFIAKIPKHIEIIVIRIFGMLLNSDKNTVGDMCEVWNNECDMVIKLCVESTTIFSIVSSIIAEVLINIRDGRFIKCLYIVKSFIINLSNACSNNGKTVIELYPKHYHNLIYLLNCQNLIRSNHFKGNDDYNEIINEICAIIQNVLEERPFVIVTLLSHQLPWCIK